MVTLAGWPIASPDTSSSTLRFCWRPAELSFVATGKVLPKPLAETEKQEPAPTEKGASKGNPSKSVDRS